MVGSDYKDVLKAIEKDKILKSLDDLDIKKIVYIKHNLNYDSSKHIVRVTYCNEFKYRLIPIEIYEALEMLYV